MRGLTFRLLINYIQLNTASILYLAFAIYDVDYDEEQDGFRLRHCFTCL